VSFLVTGVLNGSGGAELNQLPPRPTETLIAPPLADDVRQAFTDALLIISRLGHPTFARGRGTGFQAVPGDKRDLTLLIAKVPPGASASTLPELCEIRTAESMRNTTVCDLNGDCGRVPATASPTLLCNLEEWARLRTLMAAIHDSKTMTAALADDWSFMNLVTRIRQQPNDVLNGLSEQVTADHLAAHMTYLAVFVLGHELEHLIQASKRNDRLPVPLPREPEPGGRQAATDPLGAERVCRNYLAFERNGFKSFGENLGQIAVSPEDRRVVDASQQIWESELDADDGAILLVQATIRTLVSAKRQTIDEALPDLAWLSLASMAQYYWYSRLAPFAARSCGDFRDQSFFLTRCMCTSTSRFAALDSIFSVTHPPLYLRIMRVLTILLDRVKPTELTAANQTMLAARRSFYFGLMDVPVKLAIGACMVRQAGPGLGQAMALYPALEGFSGERNSGNPGYPPPATRSALMQGCIAHLK
jgi:hypothetical protein